MIQEKFTEAVRPPRSNEIEADLVIVGGGISGTCTALTAAREGVKVVLVQDRPVLGGNASSEVRLWILGATSHMGNNNRWAREGGVIDELLVENTYRNKEGNPLILDTILLEKVTQEPNITLLLNTSVYEVKKKSAREIDSILAFCSQNSTQYVLRAPLFCDASGDGIVAFQAGASFRMGAESPDEFDEGFAPDIEDYGELLGHSLYFYTKDAGYPVNFTAPAYAHQEVEKLPRIKNYQLQDHGCRLWWVEYGGRMDTVHQSEEIKWELWKVIYGIWHYVKNSGEFPEAHNLTLEWVGTIPGKRESRRFMGDYILNQKDLVEQRQHPDAVAVGGWSLDLHPADGVYSEKMGCNQWHSKGVYQIPYRCYYSKDIQNLFLAGRIISASHVAFGSSRVMATSGHGAQAVGMATALCIQHQQLPRQLTEPAYMRELQNALNYRGQSIPGVPVQDKTNLIQSARLEASSTYSLKELPYDGPWISLKNGAAQLLPLAARQHYIYRVLVHADQPTTLHCELRISGKVENFTPEITLSRLTIELHPGEQYINLDFQRELEEDQYAFVTFLKNAQVQVKGSRQRVTGVLSVFNATNKAVSNLGYQDPPEGLGIDRFEFWIPERRPGGHNLAMQITPAVEAFSTQQLKNGFTRPYIRSNAWVADPLDPAPTFHLRWDSPQTIKTIQLHFDTDFDHPMESSLMGHPENVMPFCVQKYAILDKSGRVLHRQEANHQTINRIVLPQAVVTDQLTIQLEHPSADVPAGLFAVYCFSNKINFNNQ
ncbi:MAG: FAD-dependent oxidoreductase [Cyclobacteriaceae bacterium]